MSRQQDKATNDRHARILRDLVKQPDNKACADCKKNDARWASWNLGVFLCIRCSGIHRSMGTHISKVKSIDLDMWTPEQMESIQKWGNKRANLYWERHLKAGHIPPDHKIESFIRSKYESKRWAKDGPPPVDPSVLESDAASSAPPEVSAPKPTPAASAPAPAPAPAARSAHPLLSRQTAKPAPSLAPVVDLMGGDDSPAQAPTAAPTQSSAPAPAVAQTAVKAPAPTAAPANDSHLFDLDFRAPTPSAPKPQTAKADIMSLFTTSPPVAAQPSPTQSFFSAPTSLPTQNNYASWQGGITNSAPPARQAPTQSSVPTQSSGWGLQADQNAWGVPSQPQPTHIQQPTANAWGNDPWSTPAATTSTFTGLGAVSKKDDLDPFANIWK